jgi:hypothetical protein
MTAEQNLGPERRCHPRARIPEPPITILEAGDRGGWCAGIPPAIHKDPGRRCGGGGCPAPFRRNGVRAGAPAMKAPPPARGAGLTAIIPPIWEGKGR